MKRITNHLCNGCMACYNACPFDAIFIEFDKEGFYIPVINNEKCKECGKCEKVCPLNKDYKIECNYKKLYAAQNKSDKEREKASSGGVFPLIAKFIWDRNGIVYGVAYDDNFEIKHFRQESPTDIFYGSKYVQSYIGKIYQLVKEDLDNNKLVLFSGTPCQVNGLISYLGRKYDNLVTIDFICHGVPSPMLWNKYKDELVKKYGKDIIIDFRSKLVNWNAFSFTVCRKHDGKILYANTLTEDPYLKVFLRNFNLRLSCSNCHFKGVNDRCDFTIGDFWGVENYYREYNEGKGTSVMFCNTDRSISIVDEIMDKIRLTEINDYTELLSGNPTLIQSQVLPKGRTDFFYEVLKKEDIIKVFEKYSKDPLIKRIKRRIRNLINKLK